MESLQSDFAAVGIELLVRLAGGELVPRLSLVSPKVFFSVLSPMEFWFLTVVASGLLSCGHFISSDITDLISNPIEYSIEFNNEIPLTEKCHFTLLIHYFPILILCSCFDTICIVKSAI